MKPAYSFLFIFIAALSLGFATPYVISLASDRVFEESIARFEKEGFVYEPLSKEGYLRTKRTFTLELKDGANLKSFLQALSPKSGWNAFLEEMSKEEVAYMFQGVKVHGDLRYSNILPKESLLTLTLKQLPSGMQRALLEKKELSQSIASLLDGGVLGVKFLLNSDQQIKKIILNDIAQTLHVEDETLKIEALGHELSFDNNDASFSGVAKIGKHHFSYASSSFALQSQLNALKYRFHIDNDFNHQGTLGFDAMRFEMAQMGVDHMQFSLGKTDATSAMRELNEELELDAKYTLRDIAFADTLDELTLEGLNATLALRGINAKSVKILRDDYSALMQGATPPSDEVMIEHIMNFINHGIRGNLLLELKGLKSLIALKQTTIDTQIVLPKNSYSNAQSPLELLELIEVLARVKLHQDDKKTLENLEMALPEEFALGVREGDFFLYDIELKKGQMSINGKIL